MGNKVLPLRKVIIGVRSPVGDQLIHQNEKHRQDPLKGMETQINPMDDGFISAKELRLSSQAQKRGGET